MQAMYKGHFIHCMESPNDSIQPSLPSRRRHLRPRHLVGSVVGGLHLSLFSKRIHVRSQLR